MQPLLLSLVLLGACKPFDPSALDPSDSDTSSAQDSATDTQVEEPNEAATVEASPSSLDFGSGAQGCEGDEVLLTVTNRGLEPLVLGDILIDGDAGASFQLDTSDADGQVLSTGESAYVKVSFTPLTAGELSATLAVHTNDPATPVLAVPLSGTGAEDPAVEDAFVQSVPGPLDVLWVIDNSCSMSDIINDLNTNLTAITDGFTSLSVDYQLAVVSTDMDDPEHSGKLRGDGVISLSTHGTVEAVQDAFAAASDLGAGGSANERGRDAAYAALTAPLLTTENSGFLRSNASLAIVAVSDEPDSSTIPQADFITWLDGLKANPNKTSFSAIVNESDSGTFNDQNCPGGNPAPGTDYSALANATGGLVADLCNIDFNEVMSHLAYNSAGLSSSFPLTEEPTNAPVGVTVTVAGQPVPYSPISGWMYNSETNSVEFTLDAFPGPGEAVTVNYRTAPTCD